MCYLGHLELGDGSNSQLCIRRGSCCGLQESRSIGIVGVVRKYPGPATEHEGKAEPQKLSQYFRAGQH